MGCGHVNGTEWVAKKYIRCLWLKNALFFFFKKKPTLLCFFTQKRVVKKQYSHNKKQYSFRVFLRF